MALMHDPFEEVAPFDAGAFSGEVLARKRAMLPVLQAAVARRRFRRRVVRCAAAAIVVLAGLAVAFRWGGGDRPALTPAEDAASRSPVVDRRDTVSLRNVEFALVEAREDLVDRYVVRRSSIDLDTVVIDDGELLRVMAEANRPAGLIRIGDRAYLSTDLARAFGEANAGETEASQQ
jgi:hypothetical protein